MRSLLWQKVSIYHSPMSFLTSFATDATYMAASMETLAVGLWGHPKRLFFWVPHQIQLITFVQRGESLGCQQPLVLQEKWNLSACVGGVHAHCSYQQQNNASRDNFFQSWVDRSRGERSVHSSDSGITFSVSCFGLFFLIIYLHDPE